MKKIVQVVLVVAMVAWAFSIGLSIGENKGYTERRYYEDTYLNEFELGETDVVWGDSYFNGRYYDSMKFELTRVK